MGISLRCSLWLSLVQRRGLGQCLSRRLLLNLEQLELLGLLGLLLRMVLLLWGSRFILTETAGLSCTVDLTQCVQCLALSVLQQVRLALRVRKEKRLSAKHHQIHTRLKK